MITSSEFTQMVVEARASAVKLELSLLAADYIELHYQDLFDYASTQAEDEPLDPIVEKVYLDTCGAEMELAYRAHILASHHLREQVIHPSGDGVQKEIHPMITSDALLLEFYEHECEVVIDELNDEWMIDEMFRSDEDDRALAAQETERIKKKGLLALEGRWEELNLPSPQSLLTLLLSGTSAKFSGNSICYDKDDGVTWVTSAYGIDCYFGEVPDLDTTTKFLTSIAMDEDFGPTP